MAMKQIEKRNGADFVEVERRAGFSLAVLPLPDFTWKKYRVEGGSPKFRKALIDISGKRDCKAILANAVWQ